MYVHMCFFCDIWVSHHVYVCVCTLCVSVQMYMCIWICQQQTRTSEHSEQSSSEKRSHGCTHVAIWLTITLIYTVSDRLFMFILYVITIYIYVYLYLNYTQFLSVPVSNGFRPRYSVVVSLGNQQRPFGHDGHGRHCGTEWRHWAVFGGAVHHGQLETRPNCWAQFYIVSLVGVGILPEICRGMELYIRTIYAYIYVYLHYNYSQNLPPVSVCLFFCLFVCLFVCMFVCWPNGLLCS